MEDTSQAFMSQSYLNAQETGTQATKDYLASLHSTRKQPSKPSKRPISSPLNPMHPHVYRVEPVNFKELVQRLTGAPEHEPVANPFKSLDDAAKESSSSFAFDLSSSPWGDLSLRNPANISRW
ncbi:VQ motif-containing protein 29 [Hirschfeldia incana]|nr:VQ motif-containing protein 29 [Hirschfeldia incana]